ncbi:MAG: TonB-dependent receptor [Gemmatimonadota bacterium]
MPIFARTSLYTTALLAALVLSTMPSAVVAQDPPSVVTIDPVLVRVLGSSIGTRAPYPISVVSGAELTRGTASAFIEEALRSVPGVQIHNRFNFAVGERIAIRGFGARSQFGVRGIRVLVDGIPATLPDGQATLDHLDLAGLGRVEALRGPNAALYGNAAGGVLHFRTTDPALAPANVGIRTTGGSFGLLSVQGHATGTSGDVGYRVGFTDLSYDGFRRDPEADDGSAYGRADRRTLNGTLAIPAGDGTLRIVVNGMDLDAENPGSLPQATLDEGQRAAWGFNVRSGAIKDVRQGQLGASWMGQFAGTDAEFAAWGVRRELFNPIPGRVIELDRNAGGVRALFQGSSDAGQNSTFGWGAGFETEFQSDDRQNFGNAGGTPDDLRLDQQESVRGLGLFVQGRLDVGDKVSFLAGLRFDDISFSVDDRFTAGGDPDDSGDRSMNALSPSGGVVVAVADATELFASVGRSFETPTTTELANRATGAGGFNPDLDPQSGVTFEGGARTTVDQRVALEVSLFHTEVTDGLVPFEVPTDPGRTYFRNAGRITYTGWEASADSRLAPGVSARVAFTNVDATYDLFQTEDGDFTGNAVPGQAPNRFDATLILDRGPGFVELRGLWQDDVPVDDEGTASSPSYFLADARFGFDEIESGTLRLAPFVAIANVFDTDYNASVVPNAFGSRYFEPGPGRTYRVGFGVTWGN